MPEVQFSQTSPITSVLPHLHRRWKKPSPRHEVSYYSLFEFAKAWKCLYQQTNRFMSVDANLECWHLELLTFSDCTSPQHFLDFHPIQHWIDLYLNCVQKTWVTPNLREDVYLWLYRPLLDFGCFFSFLLLYAVCRTPRMGDQLLQGRYLHRKIQTKNKRTQTSMPWLGFEPTTPVFEQARTVRALARAVTVISMKADTRNWNTALLTQED
jgi:hypothetical protein